MKYLKITVLSILLMIGIFVLTPFFMNQKNVSNGRIENSGKLSMEKIDSKDKVTYNYKNSKGTLIYSWIFDKKEINNYQNINLDMDFESEFLSKTADINSNMKILSFDHHGLLPKNTTVKVYVGDKYKEDDEINMYYYDDEIELLRYKDSYIVDSNGYVSINIEHCSDYLLTATIVQDAANNPQNINLVILVLVGVIILLVAVSLFSSNKK